MDLKEAEVIESTRPVRAAASDAARPARRAAGKTVAPRVTAIVVNYLAETENDTVECLRSLEASDYPALDIILVDNAAPPEVTDRLERAFPEVTVLRTGANLGFTGGNNRGMELALQRGCDYVLLLNNDAVVEADCVSRLVETAESHPRVGCVGGKILYHDQPDRIWFGGGSFSTVRGMGFHRGIGEIDRTPDGGRVEETTFLTGCCMLLPQQALRSVGGFEEDFFAYVEDTELSVRLRQAGFHLLYHPGARLYHRIPMDEADGTPAKIVFRDRNRRRMMRRRFPLSRRLPFYLFFVASRSVHAARYLVRRDWPRLKAIWRGATAP